IAAGKRINRGAIGGVDDENAADRRFAVVSNQCARSYHVDRMRLGAVEGDAMVAVMLGAGRQNVFLVERVDDEQHVLKFSPRLQNRGGVSYPCSRSTKRDALIAPPGNHVR